MLKKWINSFAWWLYCSTKKGAEPVESDVIHLVITADADQAIRVIEKVSEELKVLSEIKSGMDTWEVPKHVDR